VNSTEISEDGAPIPNQYIAPLDVRVDDMVAAYEKKEAENQV